MGKTPPYARAKTRTRTELPRRRATARWLRLARRVTSAALAVFLLVALPLWLWQSGRGVEIAAQGRAAVLAGSARAGLVVRDVLVEGRFEASRAQILAALDLDRGQPILALDPAAAKARLEALPWVRTASVQRRLPDTVYLRITERQPVALWQHGGRLVVVDGEGVVVVAEGVERFGDLPVIVGADAPAHAATLLAMLASEPALRARVTAAVRVSGRRWNVRIDNVIDVRLPEDDPAIAWARLARLDRSHDILSRDIRALDLRQPDRLIVQLTKDAARRVRNPGKDT